VAKVDAQAAAKLAVEVAAKQIARLSRKDTLSGWDGADLERYAGICQRYDHHQLTWLNKLDPTKCNDELLARVIATTEESEADGSPPPRRPRRSAS
jgi:hypothetical protein